MAHRSWQRRVVLLLLSICKLRDTIRKHGTPFKHTPEHMVHNILRANAAEYIALARCTSADRAIREWWRGAYNTCVDSYSKGTPFTGDTGITIRLHILAQT